VSDLLVAAPILAVPSVAESVEYYERCFGFTKQQYFYGNDVYVVITLHSAQIHFIECKNTNPNNIRSMHVADVFVWVDNLDAVCARAAANGLTALRGPERYDTVPVATTEVVYPDNNGYWICFAVRH